MRVNCTHLVVETFSKAKQRLNRKQWGFCCCCFFLTGVVLKISAQLQSANHIIAHIAKEEAEMFRW